MGKSVLEAMGIGIGVATEDEVAMRNLFPTKDPKRLLQMMTEIKPRTSPILSALGVIKRRMFNSAIIGMYEEEYRYNQIAVDGKGNIRAAEVLIGSRRPRDEGSQLPG